MSEYKEALEQGPYTVGTPRQTLQELQDELKAWNLRLVSRLLSHDPTEVFMYDKEARYLIHEDTEIKPRQYSWDRYKIESQPTQVLSDLLTMIENRQDIIKENPNLLP